MSYSYRRFLRNLPIRSELLQAFLAQRDFDSGAAFDADAEEARIARLLAERIAGYESASVRDRVIADLGRIAQLADEAGSRQIRTVCGGHDAYTAVFNQLETPEERALWLHEHHPDQFEAALEARFFDQQSIKASSTRHDLKVRRPVDRSAEARQALELAISEFYRKKQGSGQSCEVEIIDRHLEGTVQVTVYVQDLSNHRVEFDEGRLRRRRSFPAIELALNYSPKTGCADTVAKGGKEFHKQLASAFSEHLLHHQVAPERIRQKTYPLNNLRYGVTLFDPENLGLECVRLKSITVWDPDTRFKVSFSETGRNNRQSVERQIKQLFPLENPLLRSPVVIAAQIGLHFFPEAGKQRGRSLTLEFGRQGQSNFDRFDEKDRLLIERLMVEWGLVDAPSPEIPPDPKGDPAGDTDWSEAA